MLSYLTFELFTILLSVLVSRSDAHISQRSGLANELVTSYDSSLKPGLAKGVLRSYRRMILSEGEGERLV